MEFITFLRLYLTCGENYINTMSRFEREDPKRYNRYRDRVRRVSDFYHQDQQRNPNNFNKPLTIEGFYVWEKQYNALAKLRGAEPTDMRED